MSNSPDIAIWISDIEENGPSILHTDESRDTVRVYSVPVNMTLDEDKSRSIFSPSIVTIGPLHHNPELIGNAIKKEVVHNMLIPPTESSMDRSLLLQLIENVATKEDEIKNAYADRNRIPNHLHGLRFVQMVVEDSCFVLFALSLFSIKKTSERHSKLATWPTLASIFIGKEDKVVGDMLKLENQIPLLVLKCVADGIPGWESTSTEISSRIDMAKALQTMCPLAIHDEGSDKKLWRTSYRDHKGHLLSLMVQFMTQELDEEEQIIQETQERGESYIRRANRKLQLIAINPLGILILLALFIGILVVVMVQAKKDKEVPIPPFVLIMFLIVLAAVVVTLLAALCHLTLAFIFSCFWRSPRETGSRFTAKGFQAFNYFEPSSKGLQDMRLYDESVYYRMRLPKMRTHNATEIILKNMIALERCHPKLSTQRVTNYMCLMAFLIAEKGDVETLVQEDIISGKRADSEMRWIVDMRTWLDERRCLLDGPDAASDAVTGMRNLREPAGLWKLSVRITAWMVDISFRYSSSPWVAISTVGALMLLGMTAVQVACLFTHCNGLAKD